ncbi:MAG: hypothetical protein ACXVES_11430 [Actinomycetota bacterium]
MKRAIAVCIALVTAVGFGRAFGASDGTYRSERMHCSGAVDNVETPNRTEPGCHNGTVTISDVGGHEYFGIGTAQTAGNDMGPVPGVLPFGIGANMHAGDFWYDAGSGCTRYTFDVQTPGPPAQGDCPWFTSTAPNYYGPDVAPNPSSGLRIYIGFDDNVAGGEHDSSELINNGPSDGGGIHVVLDPAQTAAWVAAVMAKDPAYVLSHPLPAGDAGLGFCADGICFSLQSQRQVAYQGGSSTAPSRDVANYKGKNWDPSGCSGDDDGSDPTDNKCNDPKDPSTHQDITYWYNQDGTVYVEPGVQIYEDPDPQGSPIGDFYPIPAIYIGTCGVIVGGGDLQMPASPFTNSSGQFVFPTGC